MQDLASVRVFRTKENTRSQSALLCGIANIADITLHKCLYLYLPIVYPELD